MEHRTTVMAARLSVIGTFLILVNVLLIATNGSPIVISSYYVSSVDKLTTTGQSLWCRFALGARGIMEGPLMSIWTIFAVAGFFFAVLLILKPERPLVPSLFILLFSILSVFIGGGFVIGLILGVIGGAMSLQPRETVGETFFIKFIRAARLDSKLFAAVKDNPKGMREAAFAIIFVNMLSGLGYAVWNHNVDMILSSPNAAFRALLLGEVFYDVSMIGPPLTYVGLSVLKWILLSVIIYLIAVKILRRSAELDEVARVTAFAYAPIILQVFLPLLYMNEPFLTIHWPLALFFVTNIWMTFALVVAVRQTFDLSIRKAIGVVMLAGIIYWLLVYKMVVPTLHVPGIYFDVQPEGMLLGLVSCAITLSIFLGTLTKS